MLPFLDDHKKSVAGIMAKRNGKTEERAAEREAPGSEVHPALKDAADRILSAIEAKSPIDLAKAFKDAFDALEREPHKEAEHTEEGIE